MKTPFTLLFSVSMLFLSSLIFVSCLKEEEVPRPYSFKAGDTTQIYHTYVPVIYAPQPTTFNAVDTFLIEGYQVKYSVHDNFNSFSSTRLEFLNDSLSFAVYTKDAFVSGIIQPFKIPFFELLEFNDKIYFDYEWSSDANFSYSDYGMYFSYSIYNLMSAPDYIAFRIDKGQTYKYGWIKLNGGIISYGLEN
jgi:hypothetical protein